MPLWIQHGYGKSDRFDLLLPHGGIGGVILSPFDETPDQLTKTAETLHGLGVPIVIDPQTYVYSITPHRLGKHVEHGLEFNALNPAPSAGQIDRHVRSVGELNESMGTSYQIAPGCIIRAFGDGLSTLSLQFAVTALEQGQRRVLASAIIDENALDDWPAIERWLNPVSGIRGLSGVYVVVSRRVGGAYPYAWDRGRLTNLLRFVYALKLNDLFVLCGFLDFEGLACLVAGADGFGSGWAIGRRTFIEERWQPTGRGGLPVIRGFIPQLLSPLRVETEIAEIVRDREAMTLLDSENQTLVRNAVRLDRKRSEVSYLRELGHLAKLVDADPAHFEHITRGAADILSGLRHRAETIPRVYERRVASASQALSRFRLDEQL